MDALVKKGRKHVEDLMREAEATGSVLTNSMIQNATEVSNAWTKLGMDFEGIGNRIVDSWSKTTKKVLGISSSLIEAHPDAADATVEAGAGIGAWLTLKGAEGALARLGLGGAATAIGASRSFLGRLFPLLALGSAGGEDAAFSDEKNREFLRNRGPLAGPRAGNALDNATIARATAVHDKLMGAGIPGMTDARAWGFDGNAVQESRALWDTQPGDMGAAHGLMKWRDDRLTRFRQRYGHLPEKGNLDESVDFMKYELTGPEAEAWRAIQAAGDTPRNAGSAISAFYERPKDMFAEMDRRAELSQRLSGTVHVTVEVKHNGTSAAANAEASGRATTAPPRVITTMPMAR
jgi:hypothetical protein